MLDAVEMGIWRRQRQGRSGRLPGRTCSPGPNPACIPSTARSRGHSRVIQPRGRGAPLSAAYVADACHARCGAAISEGRGVRQVDRARPIGMGRRLMVDRSERPGASWRFRPLIAEMGSAMKAAVVPDPGAPLEIRDVPIPTPGPGQVLVRIETAGLCHTDIHAARGEWPVEPKIPLIPGHEGVGDRGAGRRRRPAGQGRRPGRAAVARLRLRALPRLRVGPGDVLRDPAVHGLHDRRQLRGVRHRVREPRGPGPG